EIVNGLTGLISQHELDRSPCLLLSDGRTVDRIAIRRDVFDPQGDNVATSQLAVDRKVEQRKVAGPSFDQESGSDRPGLVWAQRRLGSDKLALVPGRATGDGGAAVFVKHVRAPRFLRASSMLGDAQIVSAFRDLQS